MSQHDMNLLNDTGAGFRADLNNALPAIASQHSGATNPAVMFAYQRFARTDLGVLLRRNAANTANILDGTLAETLVVAKSALFTATLADHGRSFVCVNSFVLSLAAAATLGDGWQCQVINNNTFPYNIIIDPNLAELVNGAATLTIKPGQSCVLICNGVGFYTVGLPWEWLAPTGQVMFFASSVAPVGWVKANGALVSRVSYANLLAVIGTVFGAGDGSTTFGLPDLRGEFIRGWDDARGVDTGRVFGIPQPQDFLAHSHTLSGQTINGPTGSAPSALTDNNVRGLGTTTGVAGGAETRPRNVALLACIKY